MRKGENLSKAHGSMSFFDDHQVHYSLISENDRAPLNWLFVPGGAGADSQYLIRLIELLSLPGKAWCIDMPGNGVNLAKVPQNYDFGQWLDIFVDVIKQFDNPVLVGHSFGAILPLMLPELENHLKGFISINSSPSLWYKAMYQKAAELNLPDIAPERKRFIENPTAENFQAVTDKIVHYHFPDFNIEQGKKFLDTLVFNTDVLNWWRDRLIAIDFTAQWIPQKVPMLIVGDDRDCTCPFSIYQNDQRFNRENIKKHAINNAGHFAWLDKPDEVKVIFDVFLENLTANNS